MSLALAADDAAASSAKDALGVSKLPSSREVFQSTILNSPFEALVNSLVALSSRTKSDQKKVRSLKANVKNATKAQASALSDHTNAKDELSGSHSVLAVTTARNSLAVVSLATSTSALTKATKDAAVSSYLSLTLTLTLTLTPTRTPKLTRTLTLTLNPE